MPAEAAFGNPMVQVDAGDFAQLRPVPKGTLSLMEAFLLEIEGYRNQDRVRKITDIEMEGLRIFERVSRNTIEFQGTYRFKANDPLLPLLQIMRKEGGSLVPETLKQQVLSRIYCGAEDPRGHPKYRFPLSVVGQHITSNNFCNGMYSAVNWEQVARLQQVWAARNAKTSCGFLADKNNRDGKPIYRWETFPPYLCRKAVGISHIVLKTLGRLLGPSGKLLYMIQRVDRAQVQQHGQDMAARFCLTAKLLFAMCVFVLFELL